MKRPLYQRTQSGWAIRLAFLSLAVGLLAAAAAPPLATMRLAPLALAGGALAAALLGWMWGSLTVRIDAQQLQLRFGLGWPRKSVALADVQHVEVTRTRFWEGWGVHRTRRGWLYNVSGYGAVALQLRDGRKLMIGSAEPARLKAAIERAQQTAVRA